MAIGVGSLEVEQQQPSARQVGEERREKRREEKRDNKRKQCMKSSIKIASETMAKPFQKGVPEASGGSFLSSQRVVLSPPELCWTRWALRGRSGGAPETSQGRSGVSLGALGELAGPSGDTPGTPESVFFELCSDFGGVLGGGVEMSTFLDGFGVYFSLIFG